MTIYLYPNPKKDPGLSITAETASKLVAMGASVLVEESYGKELGLEEIRFADPDQGIPRSQAVITIGGDGTLLRAAKKCLASDTPILGINVGRTGFLATCEVDELEEKLGRLLAGEYEFDERRLLEAAAPGPWNRTALNDIVIYSGQRQQAMDYSIYCDGSLVSRCRGDGVIVATPTGSTAYSLSAGGPVLDAHIAGFVVNAICAHSLKNPPIVFSADRKITIQVDAREGESAQVSCDGGNLYTLHGGDQVGIQLSPTPIRLISFTPAEQFEAIDRKLRGRR